MTGRPLPKAWSVRTRTAVAMLTILLPMLLLGSVAAIWLQRGELTRGQQALAANEARTLADEIARDGVPAPAQAGELSLSLSGESPLFQVVRNGSVPLQSRELGDRSPALGGPSPAGSSRILDNVFPNEGDRYLAVGVAVRGQPATTYVVVLRSMESVEVATASTTRILAVALPLLAVVVGLLGWMLAGRALAPVERLRRTASEISSSSSPIRLPVPGTDEVGRLATTLNAMLDRIARTQHAQQQFVADASHELRSPVATIRTLMEVSALTETDADELRSDVLDETSRLQRLVDGLLMLARHDAHVPQDDFPVADLAQVVENEVGRQRQHPVAWQQRVQGPVRVAGPENALAAIADNLLANAHRHARAQVTVSLAIVDAPGGSTTSGQHARLTVCDDGPGVPEHERERIFERFVRLDAARDRDAGGAGLGLSIARELAVERGGSLVCSPSESGGRFNLTLPLVTGQLVSEPLAT